ncbi:hypothetical protein [Paenibacillus nasutitermitis]|uniref:Uncharacterized protein n=1 Tax=Paenibacillus nasutitermitis TaxID=1652958 RepID=A0A916ZE44_9BACL|nr:hypothetical protein [Paenibacillus nasutitermitis]GGD89361.1 hypothetical protein GCM10010911_54970 [Paenibacillus nasutitermitis]
MAAIVTEYRHNSHAEMIIGRLLGEFGYIPQLEVVSLYTDQMPDNDRSRAEADRCGIGIFTSIRETIMAGGQPIDGVIIIGEHGEYPINDKGQKMYPRRWMMEQVLQAIDDQGLHIPIFLDKHMAYDFEDAMWIYREVTKRGLPFLGGSSIPLAPVVPALDLSCLRDVKEIFVTSWLGTESYGFHGMEVLQSLAERRSGGETGVSSIEVLEGDDVWKAMNRGEWPDSMMHQALSTYPSHKEGHPWELVEHPVLFLFNYIDGLKGYVLQLGNYINQWAFSLRTLGGQSYAARHNSDLARPYNHFGTLTRLIEEMVITGRSSVAIERTLLTTGMIDIGMDCLYRKRGRLTPELAICYNSKSR